MARWGDVPAVRRARRRVDRLRGGQLCRRALRIRSEVSGPPSWFRGRMVGRRGVGSPPVLGRAGWGYAGRCPDPPRNLRFLGFSFCCRLFGRTDASPQSIGASRDHRGAAPSVRTSLTPETPTQRANRHQGDADRVAPCASAAGCRLSLPQRRQFVLCSPQKCTAAGCAVTMAAQPAS